MLPKLTPTDLETLVFKRFRAVYGLKGAWAMKDDPRTFAEEWLRILKWSQPEEVQQAVDGWLASNKDEWPKPGQLYGLIAERRPKQDRGMASEDYELEHCPCGRPGCGWHFYRLENGGMRLLQDCQAKRRGLEGAA